MVALAGPSYFKTRSAMIEDCVFENVRLVNMGEPWNKWRFSKCIHVHNDLHNLTRQEHTSNKKMVKVKA
jgi:hypothetical protein